jgi:protein-disulfide isomerase
VNKLIDTGAVAAAYCVADESIDAFRRFHAALYAQQPEETATVFPDNGG